MNKTHLHNQTNRYTKMYYKSTAQKCMPLSNAWATLFMELSHSRNPFAARILCVHSECLCHFLRLLRCCCCCCFNFISGLHCIYTYFLRFAYCLDKYICILFFVLVSFKYNTNAFESILGENYLVACDSRYFIHILCDK